MVIIETPFHIREVGFIFGEVLSILWSYQHEKTAASEIS
jgi:hypothetical protein